MLLRGFDLAGEGCDGVGCVDAGLAAKGRRERQHEEAGIATIDALKQNATKIIALANVYAGNL